MQFKTTFRARFIISYIFFGLFIASILAVYIYFDLFRMELDVVDDYVTEQMDDFIGPPQTSNMPRGKNLHRLRLNDQPIAERFQPAKNLSPGLHLLESKGHSYRLLVSEKNNNKYAVLYDITNYVKTEEQFGFILILGGLFSVILSAWIGYILSKRVISPVTMLANMVEANPGVEAKLNLSSMFADDEIGRLARAFDSYLLKLDQFIQREKSFTADASHELRTPLMIIQSTVEMLLEKGNLPPKALERIDRIGRASAEMTQCLDALLVMAREAKPKDNETEPTDIAQCVSRIVEQYESNMGNPEIQVTNEIAADPKVDAPENIINLLISNIIRNAFRYTEKGSISIQLNNHALTVRDSGVGINHLDLPRVFDRGFRGDKSEGSGLGLSIVKRICDHYGWKVHLDSTEGRGTTVMWKF